MLYAYSNRHILALSHNVTNYGEKSIFSMMAGGNDDLRAANLRLMYGYLMCIPGKKLGFMKQEIERYGNYFKDLHSLYIANSELFEIDDNESGFEWINNFSANESIVVFLRKNNCGEMLLVVANFTPVARSEYKIGVPFKGKYKEIFNSDNTVYGGVGIVNKRMKLSKEDECDGRENSIRISVPPLGITIFSCARM